MCRRRLAIKTILAPQSELFCLPCRSHGVWWLAGTWPGGRGTARAGRKLAPSDAFRQGIDHDACAIFSGTMEAISLNPTPKRGCDVIGSSLRNGGYGGCPPAPAEGHDLLACRAVT